MRRDPAAARSIARNDSARSALHLGPDGSRFSAVVASLANLTALGQAPVSRSHREVIYARTLGIEIGIQVLLVQFWLESRIDRPGQIYILPWRELLSIAPEKGLSCNTVP
jgi:hypothetical protein